MKYLSILSIMLFSLNVSAKQDLIATELSDLKNFQINTDTMVSSGLPNKKHFQTLQSMGVTNVIDLIPGDRTEESKLLKELKLNYHNIPVDWDSPTLENFKQYVALMAKASERKDKTLTHCKLNWRGATFTYLYRVTQLNESEQVAEQDMVAIWQPNETWQAFIDEVKNEYK